MNMDAFTGESVLDGNSFSACMTYKGETETRHLMVGDELDCYRNLNKPAYFSLKARKGEFKSKVCGYATCVVLNNVDFVVGEKSRLRVLSSNRKNVHAYCRGKLIDTREGGVDPTKLKDYQRVTYSPYMDGNFHVIEECINGVVHAVDKVLTSVMFTHAIISGSNVLLTDL